MMQQQPQKTQQAASSAAPAGGATATSATEEKKGGQQPAQPTNNAPPTGTASQNAAQANGAKPSAGASGKDNTTAAPKTGAPTGKTTNTKVEESKVPASAAAGGASAPKPQQNAAATDKSKAGKDTAAASKAAPNTNQQTKGGPAAAGKAPAAPQGMTQDQVRQLDEMRKQIQESRDKRRDKERILELMKSLVEQKRQLDGIIVSSESKIKAQNAENDQLEKKLVQLQVQVKTEELVKELNAHKANKKTDAFIQQQIKTQEDQAKREAAQINGEEVQLEKEKAELLKQIEKTIPDQINKVERETDAIKAKKPRLNKQRKLISEQINEINVLDSQLQGQAINSLSMQVNPAFKGTIEEKDINNYKEMLDKIHRNLIDSQSFLPAQERNYQQNQSYASPERRTPSHANPFSVSASPAFGANSSPSPFASAGSGAKMGFKMPNMGIMEQFGMANLVNSVQKQATQTVSLLSDREDFILRERTRKEFMEQDKLQSMKKVMQYQEAIDRFPQLQANLKTEIDETKVENALMVATLRGIFSDKKYISEIMARKQQEEEELAALEEGEGVDSGEQEDQEEEDGQEGDGYGQEQQDGEEPQGYGDEVQEDGEDDMEGEEEDGTDEPNDTGADLVHEQED